MPDQTIREVIEPFAAEAVVLVGGDRNRAYGHPLDDYTKTAALWQGILGPKLAPGEAITPEDAILCMVGVKLSREVNRPNRDNIVDAIGYLLCYVAAQYERGRRAARDAGGCL